MATRRTSTEIRQIANANARMGMLEKFVMSVHLDFLEPTQLVWTSVWLPTQAATIMHPQWRGQHRIVSARAFEATLVTVAMLALLDLVDILFATITVQIHLFLAI